MKKTTKKKKISRKQYEAEVLATIKRADEDYKAGRLIALEEIGRRYGIK